MSRAVTPSYPERGMAWKGMTYAGGQLREAGPMGCV